MLHKIHNATLQVVAPYQIQKLDVPKETIESIRGFTIYFKHEFLSLGVDQSNFLKDFPFFKLGSTANIMKIKDYQEKALIDLCERMYFEYEIGKTQIRSEEIIRGCLWIFLNDCLRIYHNSQHCAEIEFDCSRPQLIADIFREKIELHFESKTMVQEYAELLNITPNHLTQTIKDVTGKRAKDFITERRIIEAKRRLKFTIDSVAEIAYQLNFSEASNFVKAFKKYTGRTPQEYREASNKILKNN